MAQEEANVCAASLRHLCHACSQLISALSANERPRRVPIIKPELQEKYDGLFEGSLMDKPVTALPGVDDTAHRLLEHNVTISIRKV